MVTNNTDILYSVHISYQLHQQTLELESREILNQLIISGFNTKNDTWQTQNY